MRGNSILLAAVVGVLGGCSNSKPFIAFRPATSTAATSPASAPTVVTATPATASIAVETPPPAAPAAIAPSPTTAPVATSELGTVSKVPGLAPKPKPFIAIPKPLHVAAARPSTLLLEHASPDSPVPLSEFAKQPAHVVGDFHLRAALSSEEVERQMGPPAQLADCDDPWLVYRLKGEREIWLHFTGPLKSELDAADVIRGAEDGYVRTRVFSADPK